VQQPLKGATKWFRYATETVRREAEANIKTGATNITDWKVFPVSPGARQA
jgi:hypothetical protein